MKPGRSDSFARAGSGPSTGTRHGIWHGAWHEVQLWACIYEQVRLEENRIRGGLATLAVSELVFGVLL
jgi:hypothetical protein